jgi:exopolyphosphatase/guanosine-5'-triphosphate,3'-diphosphate pyrophosphatase
MRAEAKTDLVLAATGGTASVLAAMELRLVEFDRDRIESLELTRKGVEQWTERLWSLPLAERRELPGLPPPRADVMLAGVLIFECIMQEFDFGELRISTRGLRFAALRELWKENGKRPVEPASESNPG